MTSATPQFRICTLVTDWGQYEAMQASFIEAGFRPEHARFSAFDNSNGTNSAEPYALINRLVAETAEPYIILCHQDVRADRGYGLEQLKAAIDGLNRRDPDWAVAGNAGCTDDFEFILRVADPNGFPLWDGPLPLAVNSLDENFLLLRRAASGVRASASLSGFHLYGTDICINARLAGHGCYVVDFVLTHLSAGTFGPDFFRVRQHFVNHWSSTFHFLYLVRDAEIFVTRWSWLRNIGPKARVKRLLMRHRALRRLMTWELRRPRRGDVLLRARPLR